MRKGFAPFRRIYARLSIINSRRLGYPKARGSRKYQQSGNSNEETRPGTPDVTSVTPATSHKRRRRLERQGAVNPTCVFGEQMCAFNPSSPCARSKNKTLFASGSDLPIQCRGFTSTAKKRHRERILSCSQITCEDMRRLQPRPSYQAFDRVSTAGHRTFCAIRVAAPIANWTIASVPFVELSARTMLVSRGCAVASPVIDAGDSPNKLVLVAHAQLQAHLEELSSPHGQLISLNSGTSRGSILFV
jgi:hypothetical protein